MQELKYIIPEIPPSNNKYIGRNMRWAYQDAKGEWHMTRGMKPIHFLKDAIADHANEYRSIIEQHLKNG